MITNRSNKEEAKRVHLWSTTSSSKRSMTLQRVKERTLTVISQRTFPLFDRPSLQGPKKDLHNQKYRRTKPLKHPYKPPNQCLPLKPLSQIFRINDYNSLQSSKVFRTTSGRVSIRFCHKIDSHLTNQLISTFKTIRIKWLSNNRCN